MHGRPQGRRPALQAGSPMLRHGTRITLQIAYQSSYPAPTSFFIVAEGRPNGVNGHGTCWSESRAAPSRLLLTGGYSHPGAQGCRAIGWRTSQIVPPVCALAVTLWLLDFGRRHRSCRSITSQTCIVAIPRDGGSESTRLGNQSVVTSTDKPRALHLSDNFDRIRSVDLKEISVQHAASHFPKAACDCFGYKLQH